MLVSIPRNLFVFAYSPTSGESAICNSWVWPYLGLALHNGNFRPQTLTLASVLQPLKPDEGSARVSHKDFCHASMAEGKATRRIFSCMRGASSIAHNTLMCVSMVFCSTSRGSQPQKSECMFGFASGLCGNKRLNLSQP